MPIDLNAYLASRYLDDAPKPAKKRKRKHDRSAAEGLLITDDDPAGWTTTQAGKGDDDGLSGPAVAGTSAEFRRAKKSGWKVLGGTTGPSAAPGSGAGDGDDDGAAAADAVLSAAAADKAAAQAAGDEAPVLDGDGDVVKMADGTHAGLQAAHAVTAQLERAAREERRRYDEETRAHRARGGAAEGETSHREAGGRRVADAALQREAARARTAAADQEAAARKALRGDVQVEEARRRREALEDAAAMPLARRADDVEMNADMKVQARWNDPMAQFASEKKRDGLAGAAAGKAGGGRVKGRPVYAGPAQPNRYGIRPGYRWDGVDRSNGFEAERFKALNRRERNKGLDYAWQMDE